MTLAYLSLGSNMGDRQQWLSRAVELLSAASGVTVTAKSSIYYTAPWGPIKQDDFYNAVLEIETVLPPLALLDLCQRIELECGRVRETRWGERTLDIDMLLYGAQTIEDERLTVPHPYLRERRFVLTPLAELVGERALPLLGNVVQALSVCADELQVQKLVAAEQW